MCSFSPLSLVATVQLCVTDERTDEGVRWQEFVGDIWDKRLPHFRDSSGDGGMYVYNPITGTYGFEGLDDERPLPEALDDAAAAQMPGDHDDTQGPGDHEDEEGDIEEWEVVTPKPDDTNTTLLNKCV